MAVKVTLTQDKDKGPGYGRLALIGLGQVSELTLRFESNQINHEHLQLNGQWGASPASHDCILLERNNDNLVIGLEPKTIDALIKNSRATYRVIISAEGSEKISPLRVPVNLLGSGAIQKNKTEAEGPDSVFTVPPVNEDKKSVQVSEPIIPERKRENKELNEDKKKSFLPLLVFLVVMLLAGLGAGWYMCLIPGLPPGPACQAHLQPVVETATSEAEQTQAEPDSAPKSLYEQALILQKQGNLVEAKAKLQTAANDEAHVDAMKKLAEMYDPEFWSKETSPLADPDWETANWWWEKASETGDSDAKRQAAYNMAKYSTYDTEKRKGISILEELAAQNDEKAITMRKEIIGE